MVAGQVVHVVSCHAEGEVGDVIVGGIQAPPGNTLWDQREYIATNGVLRDFMLNEPRGGVFRHCNLLVPPKHSDADMGFIIMEPAHTPPMSGSNSICVATVLLETGIVAMIEPVTHLLLEAPGGLVPVVAYCQDGKVVSVTIQNMDSFVVNSDVSVRVEGTGELKANLAFGGDSFVIVEAKDLGLSLHRKNALKLAQLGEKITKAANEQLTFKHPELPEWSHISFCLFAGDINRNGTTLSAQSAVVINPGKVDRSPTGTAVCARMALLYKQEIMTEKDEFVATSIIGSKFTGRIAGSSSVGGIPAIKPTVTGRAWRTGTHQLKLDPADPYPRGYRLSDTWPGAC